MFSTLPSLLKYLSTTFVTLCLVRIVSTSKSLGHELNCYEAPDVCPNSNVTFWLYTRELQDHPYQLDVDQSQTIEQAPFVETRPIVVLVHGFTGHKDTVFNTDVRSAYLGVGEYNIISVDFGPLVRGPCYMLAVQNLPVASRCTAQLLDALVRLRQFSLQDMHVVGFSLGAHTSGMVSRHLKSGRLGRITGLDPAKPLFMTTYAANRLSKSDANFVDVIHTDGSALGFFGALGHVDFYVNGGREQPGCEDAPRLGRCNHDRAPLSYAEAIRYNGTNGFWGFECDTWFTMSLGMCKASGSAKRALMGWSASNRSRGVFIVPTNKEPPYAMGM